MEVGTGRFAGRVAVVIGAGHGIGAATARRLFAEGASVALLDRDPDSTLALAAELDRPERILCVDCDVTDTASVNAAVDAAFDRFGTVHVLAHVAGGASPHEDLLDGMTDDYWNAEIDLNLTGAMRAVRAVAGRLPRGGSIVLVGSVNGLQAFGDEAYSAAKAGLGILARNAAVRLGPAGVRINVVAPGTVRTRVWDHQGGPDRLAGMYPLGRVGEPHEIASAIAFLASDEASFITGITLPVEGGVLAGHLRQMEHGRS